MTTRCPRLRSLAAATLLGIFLAACAQAPKAPLGDELVVVLPGHDGKVGGVVVRRDGGERLLDQPYSASRIVATPFPPSHTRGDPSAGFGHAQLDCTWA